MLSGIIVEIKIYHSKRNINLIKDDKKLIRNIVLKWSKNEETNVIITSGGTGLTGRDVTPEAVEEILEKRIDGFSTIFHMISFLKIKTSTIQSRALAGILNETLIFCLPGSPNAVTDAWDEILAYQLDIRHKPCNFIEIMDRFKE